MKETVPTDPVLTDQQAEQVTGGYVIRHRGQCTTDCGNTPSICAIREKGNCEYGYPSRKSQKVIQR